MKIKSIRNTKIKTKLLVLGLISIGGLLFLGTESILTARQINQASTDISESWLPSIIIAEELNKATSDYRLKENYHVIAKDEAMMRFADEELGMLRGEIKEKFDRYENYITSPKDHEMMLQAQELWNQYLLCSEDILALSRAGQTEQALELIREGSRTLFEESSGLILQVVEFNKTGAEQASIKADRLYHRLTREKTIIIVVVVAVIALILSYIIQAIEKPVEALVEGTRRVANGDLSVHLDYRSEDEIGVLTRSVNALIGRLNDMIKDEKHLLHQIGNENYHAESECQKAYCGDFAPILYAITSLQNRLEQNQLNQKKHEEQSEKQAVIEHISTKGHGKMRK
ncbi:MAG: MCP four helix bundle domain-containing protein [Hungatella sp.]